jgi:3-oxoacyl-[acyl-carrier-protein] synthase II
MSATAPAPDLAAAGARTVAVTGWAVHVPGLDPVARFAGGAPAPAHPPERAHELLGRKGLLAKEPATRLALCAVHRVLGLPAGAARPAGRPDPGTAVVASSNLGNAATVCRVTRTVHETGVRDVSPLDVPNASSNVVSSTVAIWFRLGGPNLMVCSGAGSGLDAVALASLLLRGGRADRCVVVGAEPDDEVASDLYGSRGARLCAGAGAVVLELAAPGSVPAIGLGPVRRAAAAGAVERDPRPGVLLGPGELTRGGQRVIDLVREVGDTYGALGVIQVALGAALVAAEAAGSGSVVCVCGDDVDGWRSVELTGGRASWPR